MQEGQPNKKLRLETTNDVFTHRGSSSFDQFGNQNDNSGLWGEDLNLDDEMMQQIESQALSQYQENRKTCCTADAKGSHHARQRKTFDDERSSDVNQCAILQQDLQMKHGEVRNLRLENDKLRKGFSCQLAEKDAIIEKLNKQLIEKQSEIDFQKMEKFSQSCRTPKSSKLHQNINSPFREKFQFTQSRGIIRDGKIFYFGGQLNKGDILYKLLHPAFDLNTENGLKMDKGNEFTLYLNCCLLQLCRLTSFEKLPSLDLIKLIVFRSREVLLTFLQKLKEKEIKPEQNDKKLKVNIIQKSVTSLDKFTTVQQELLTNSKWFREEKGTAIRQTVTMLAKLIQIEPRLLLVLIKSNDVFIKGYDCKCTKGFVQRTSINVIVDHESSFRLLANDETENYELSDNTKKTESTVNLLELFDEIVQEISLQKNFYKYEGIFSSVLYFFSTLCDHCSTILDEKSENLVVKVLKNIVFLSPGFVTTHFVLGLLNSGTQHNISDSLCRRSAAETFTENLRSYCFTKDTCALQVLCAHIELAEKSSYFVDKFTSWMIKMTTGLHCIKWMHNETNSKFCECLPTVEQITVRILLHSMEEMRKESLSIAEKLYLNSSTKRCSGILRQFRWQDKQFNVHIANCLIEYEILLHYLSEYCTDDSTKKFFLKEIAALKKDKKHHAQISTDKRELIKSILEFSPILAEDVMP